MQTIHNTLKVAAVAQADDVLRRLTHDELATVCEADDGVGRGFDRVDEVAVDEQRLTLESMDEDHGAPPCGLDLVADASCTGVALSQVPVGTKRVEVSGARVRFAASSGPSSLGREPSPEREAPGSSSLHQRRTTASG